MLWKVGKDNKGAKAMKGNLELLIDNKTPHGECPIWDDKEKVLYWIDGVGQKIHRFNPLSREDKYLETGQCVGCIALKEDGGLIAALHHGLYCVNFKKEEITFIINPEEDLPQNRFNDGKCDTLGRLWVGTMYVDGTVEKSGSLFKIERGKAIKVISNITISNGIAWSEDNKTMYYIDSPTKEVAAFDFDIIKGEISNKRIAVKIPEGEGIPDGMTIDKNNHLWIAHWGGGRVSKWDPVNSRKLDELKIPAINVSSCTFGGENMNELYITTARIECSDDILKKYPHSGGLYRTKVNPKGKKVCRYKK